MRRFRPQILTIGIGLTILAYMAMELGATELAGVAVGGLVSVATKLAEQE